MESLAQLEALCERLYNSQDTAERAHAENSLRCFSVNKDYIPQCQYILDNSSQPYSLMLASSSLLKQVTDHSLPLNLRLDIRAYIVNYLATRGPEMQPFVIASLIQLLCRLTKLGWLDGERFRDVVKESTNFLEQGSADHYAIGLRILDQLVQEMNQIHISFELPSFVSMRSKVSACYRYTAGRLQELALSLALRCVSFDFVGTSIDESTEEVGTVQIPTSWRSVLEDPSTLQIFFDYYGSTDSPLSKEALECLVRLASVRRSMFTDDATRSKFLAHLMTGTKEILQTGKGLADHDNYHVFCRLLGRFRLNYQLSELVKMDGYGDWIQLLAEFTLKSLQSWQWANSSVYHLLGMWSRLVASVSYLKGDSPSLLDEFVPKITEGFIISRFDSVQANVPDDPTEHPLDKVEVLQDELDCFPYLCRFQYERIGMYIINTMEPLLQSYTERGKLQFADNSELALIEAKLSWVVHIVAAIVKIKQCSGCSMETQEVLDAELSSRVLRLIDVMDSGLHIQANVPDDPTEHPLDKVEVLQDELDCFPYLCRFQYERIGMYIINTMEPLLQSYTERGKLQFADNSELALIEAKLSWVVHIVAAIVKIKQCSGCSMETQEVLDAELSSRVLRLIDVMDSGLHIQRYGEISKQRLERAILTFFQNFRKSYVGDQAMHSSKQLYARLKDLRGLDDHLMLLNVIVCKIATNLKCYTQSEEVIGHTLSLFHELASGYMTGKLLLKLETVNFIISNHTREQFPFLEEYRCSRSRTTFYYTVGWLIFMEDSSIKFKTSMEPLMQVFRTLESTPDSMFRTDTVKFALIGLMKSLRGISMASSSKRSYGLLFDWLYPAHMPLLLRGISNWFDTPEVTTPLLKFMAEFVHNKNQRLTFDSSSPNGILLFREVSKLIVAYGSRILSLPNVADIYAFKYKGFWVSLTILSRALSGNYCNFGVFELYGDPALADALDIALKMTLSIPLADILTYRKLTKAYFGFVEVLCGSYITFILQLDTATFMHLVGSLESGLKGLDTSISSQCAIAVDNLATYYFNNITMGEAPNSPAAIRFAQHIADCPSLFPEILKTLFEIVLLEDCGNQWSLSRPILSLILISEQIFSDLKAKILSSQPVDQHQRLSACFDSLMTDISRGLDPKNRDMFTQNLNRFRLEFRVK
ncbi:hypothetical protein F2Q68_00023235 [Brassica cretica]|uniref:Importin N-terminal domain-containing protein n=1 Tax=Brassica cretica TaxID=69181 RepID=A0A8S9FWJ9_BRACR|nr:hypothetical protein F2Q68_00023235 [Brassica cretica]